MDREADDSNRADQDLETEEHTEADQEDTDPYFAEPDEPEDSVEQWRRRFAQNPGLRPLSVQFGKYDRKFELEFHQSK